MYLGRSNFHIGIADYRAQFYIQKFISETSTMRNKFLRLIELYFNNLKLGNKAKLMLMWIVGLSLTQITVF